MRTTIPTTASDIGLYERVIRIPIVHSDMPKSPGSSVGNAAAMDSQAISNQATSTTNLPPLPWDVVRLILEHVRSDCEKMALAVQQQAPSGGGRPAGSLPPPLRARSTSIGSMTPRTLKTKAFYSDLAQLSLVSKDFCREVRALLFRHIDLSKLWAIKAEKAMYWAFQSPDRVTLCAIVRSLRVKTVNLTGMVAGLVRACVNLQTLELDVGGIEKRECLVDCLQGSLITLKHLEEVRLLEVTSVKAFPIVQSLPYRLKKLVVSGYDGEALGVGGFWENSYEWYNAEEVHFIRCKVLKWNAHFFFAFFEQHSALPPTIIRSCNGYFDLATLPEGTIQSVETLELEDPQKLLDLNALSRFSSLRHIIISSKHDFLTLDCDLSQVRRLTILRCNQPMVKLLAVWLERGCFAQLEQLEFVRNAFAPHEKDAPSLSILDRFDAALKSRNLLVVEPGYPMDLFQQAAMNSP